ncbi:MAG: S41 family peptidase [Phycisphaerae bacterium]|nr:S41 family peptidase [Phycisphaerae bacterium]
MKRFIVFILVLLLSSSTVFSMSSAAPPQEQAVQKPQVDKTELLNAAMQEIYRGDFSAAEDTVKRAGDNRPAAKAVLDIISQYNKIAESRQQAKRQAYEEKLAELEKFRQQAEVNEPNVVDVFLTVVKLQEAADANDKAKILEDAFVQDTIARSQKMAAEYEAKGEWIDALLYCYSWLTVLDPNNKEYTDRKEEVEEKMVVKASLTDSPCESSLERYEKIKPEMFIRSLDVLEYSYVETFYYSSMVEKAIQRCRFLAEVLRLSDNFDANSFKVQFEKGQIPQFISGLSSLEKEYKGGAVSFLSRDQFARLFRHILALNSATVKLPEQIVIWHFADACFNTLDPHTMLVWPKQVEDFEKNLTNEFTGIGVEISKQDGFLKAVSLVPDTPAYNSGLDAGDIIEAVNGESTKEMSITCAVSKITGPAGTKVRITVRRPDEEKSRDIEITRAKIIVPTTRGWCRDDNGNWLYFVDDKKKIGYVRVTQFSAKTAEDLDGILTQLEIAGMESLILDFRYNSGGYLQSAVEITDLFVEKGTIVSTQPRVGMPTWESAKKRGTHPNYPIVILINSGSASASEIVGGALADKMFSRAILVGEQSYGKGSVQTITAYPGGGAQLKYTMAYYHLPSGQRVNDRHSAEKQGKKDWGIMPDIKIELSRDEIKKRLDTERDNDILAAANHDTNKQKLIRHNLAETLDADKQLAVAILIAKTKIIELGLK